MENANRGIDRIGRGDLVLSAARILYLVVAALSLLAVVIALGGAAFFQFGTLIPPKQVAVPAGYAANESSVDLALVDAHLAPPHNIRFFNIDRTISSPLSGNEILGAFDADSANALGRYPDDFDIVGGPDAALFDKTLADSVKGRSGLRPSPLLVAQINHALETLKNADVHSYAVSVVARDAYRNISPPATIKVVVFVAPPGTVVERPDHAVSPLESLAVDIATVIDPSHSPRFFDVHNRALRVPRQCGADASNLIFVANFRRAFEHARSRLTLETLPPFYDGVCDGWASEVRKEAAAQNAQLAARLENARLAGNADIAHFLAKASRNGSLWVAGGAFVFFMFISLLLAFLAIESHARAMRDTLENDKRKTP
ncbi:MAG: hypothetical protein P4L57_13575 [Rhizomicrobium sp.]|nr:hypothetical protein [Rhizomicrobium sp.]